MTEALDTITTAAPLAEFQDALPPAAEQDADQSYFGSALMAGREAVSSVVEFAQVGIQTAAHSVGEFLDSIPDKAANFSHAIRRNAVRLGAIAIAFGGAGTAALAIAESSANAKPTPSAQASAANSGHTRIIHRRSNISLQQVMDIIHNDLPSGDLKHYNGAIGPNSAYMTGNDSGFTTSCAEPSRDITQYIFKAYDINTAGTSWKACDTFMPLTAGTTKRISSGRLQGKLNALDDKVLKGVDIDKRESGVSTSANLKKGTIKFKLPLTARSGYVEKIVLTPATAGHTHTEATITESTS